MDPIPKTDSTTDKFLHLLLNDKKMKLEYLQEQHRIDIAIFNAKTEMIKSDIEVLENKLGSSS